MRLWKTVRWIFLAFLLAVLVLLLMNPRPPAATSGPAARKQLAGEFEEKLQNLERARLEGQSGAFESFTTEEVNAGLQAMMENAGAAAPSPEQGKVENVSVSFEGDEVIGQASVERFRKDVYVTVRGHIGARDGYVTFEPTGFKIGNLSIPVSLVNPRLQQRLDEPEVRERLRLPEFIGEMRVRDGKLEIIEK